MRQPVVIWLSITLLIVQWGCAHAPPRPVPQPLSEEVRATLGTIGVVSAAVTPETQFKGPTGGKLHGTGKGAAVGFLAGAGRAAMVTPPEPLSAALWLVFVVPAVAAVGTVAGGVYGAFAAESGGKVKEAEAALNKALGELKVQETMRDRVLQEAVDKTPHTFVLIHDQAPYSSLADKGIDTVLEISVLRFGLAGSGVNPPLALVISVRASLIRISDGTELYGRPWIYHSRKRKLTDWAADDAQPFREEVDRVYQGLAERIVEELFLLYHIQ